MKESTKTFLMGIAAVALIIFTCSSAGEALDKEHDAHQAKMQQHQAKYK